MNCILHTFPIISMNSAPSFQIYFHLLLSFNINIQSIKSQLLMVRHNIRYFLKAIEVILLLSMIIQFR